MKYLLLFTVLLSQATPGATLSKAACVLNVYGEKIPVATLQSGDEIQITDEKGALQEAEVINVKTYDEKVTFDILDHSCHTIKDENTTRQYKTTKTSSISIKISMLLLGLSALPTANAGIATYGACVVACAATCGVASFFFTPVAGICMAAESAGGCALGCAYLFPTPTP